MSRKALAISDAIAIAVVTAVGYVFHGDMDWSIIPRFLIIFIPLVAAWFALAPGLGLFRMEIISDPKQLWRPALIMLVAAPFAAQLRANLLGAATVLLIFANILVGMSMLGMALWRGIYLFFFLKRKK